MALQKKQIRLVNDSLETGSLTEAAKTVGYSPNNTGQLYGLAKDPTTPLGAYIEKRRKEIT